MKTFQTKPFRSKHNAHLLSAIRYPLAIGILGSMLPFMALPTMAADTPAPAPDTPAVSESQRYNVYGAERVTLGQKSSKDVYLEVRGKNDLLLTEPWPAGITAAVFPTPAAGNAPLVNVDSSMSGRLKISVAGNDAAVKSYQVKVTFKLPGETVEKVRVITVDVIEEEARGDALGRININTVASVMDAKTARQAFGSRTSLQFHILDVMFANETGPLGLFQFHFAASQIGMPLRWASQRK